LPPAWAADGDWSHPHGTDSLGRDILSRLIFGAEGRDARGGRRGAGAAALGSALAIVAGYYGGLADGSSGARRCLDVVPPVIAVAHPHGGFGAGLDNVILAIIHRRLDPFCR
jgi:peptide/nickel transport system permease protein